MVPAAPNSMALVPFNQEEPSIQPPDFTEVDDVAVGIHKVWGSTEKTTTYGPQFAGKAKLYGGKLETRHKEKADPFNEIVGGDLWKRRLVLLMLIPDIKSVPSRDFLMAAGLLQAHLHHLGLPLCVVLPMGSRTSALSLADDFALLKDRNVEIYLDRSGRKEFFRSFGLFRRTHAARRTNTQRLEALGYYLMRGCCGPAKEPCCCVHGYGFFNGTSYLGGVFLLGPGDEVHYCFMDEGAGGMKVDCESIIATCRRRVLADARKREKAGTTILPG